MLAFVRRLPTVPVPPVATFTSTFVPSLLLAAAFGMRYCRFEQLKRIHLTLEALTTENGCLTPTLKIRRCVRLPLRRTNLVR